MSSISVKWRGVDSAISMYSQQRQELSSIMASVRSVKSYRCMSGGGFSSVYSALDRVITRLTDEKGDIKSLEAGMTDILKAYENCEKQIVGDIEAGNVDGRNSLAEWNDKILDDISRLKEDLVRLIGDGIAAGGVLIPEWINYIRQGEWIDDAVNFLSNSNNIISVLGELVSGNEKWNALLPGAAVSAQWAGYILYVLSNGIENYGEFKSGEISGYRAVDEFFIETVTDIGLGVLATKYMGAEGVVVVWAGNEVCKWITGGGDRSQGRDIGEIVADSICDHPILAAINPVTSPIGISILTKKIMGISY